MSIFSSTVQSAAPLPLQGATIVISPHSEETTRIAAGELARYLYLLTGIMSKVVTSNPVSGVVINLVFNAASQGTSSEQGYRLKVSASNHLTISAQTAVGLLYGVYGLLEELGMGFYAGGETFPERPTDASIPITLDQVASPAFAVRGNMLHYNFICGCTTWGLADYKFYFDQLARMRCNMLLMHWYDWEPTAAYEVDGEYLSGDVTPNTLTKPWGALAALRTSEFSFKTGRYFDEEIFSSPNGEDLPPLLTEIKRTEAMFSQATVYARKLGIGIAAGFEAPSQGDPTDEVTVAHFRARIRQFIRRNPALTHFALWQHESGGCFGSTPPASGTPARALMEQQRDIFAYLGTDRRVWEAIRFGQFAKVASEVLAEERPGLPMVVVGWGGDRWMRFADYCLAYDKLLPANVIFTCHDNIDASIGENVSTPWGELPPERGRWALPWVEGDIDECMVRQPNVEILGKLAPDAMQKGCQGMMTMQWRTRDVEEETGFIARFAWDTTLTPDRFYHDLARHQFGVDHEADMGQHLATLQRLGSRWTGVRGTVECGTMTWCGWNPHFPFEVDRSAVPFLLKTVQETIEAFAEVPQEIVNADEGAFHMRAGDGEEEFSHDTSRLGVAEMTAVYEQLQSLANENDAQYLRNAFKAIEEKVYPLRAQMVKYGMITRGYRAIDGFLIPLHHMQRNAGASVHFSVLQKIRADLAQLRASYLTQGRLARLERLDYLIQTMDFVMHYDTAAMLLADHEMVDKALAGAEAAATAGNTIAARDISADCYTQLVAAGLQQAILDFTKKLTTRCDFGTLATFNVKVMPLYWETIAKLESYLPAIPPRELTAQGKIDEIWLSWKAEKQASGYHLYRRLPGDNWNQLSINLLHPKCLMYIDRPEPGIYEYALSAVDENGWESPKSHVSQAVCGTKRDDLHMVACKPFGQLKQGEDYTQHIVALSQLGISNVVMNYRMIGTTYWHVTAMTHRFRDSFTITLPASELPVGTLEFYIEAQDTAGNTACWPITGPTLPATLVIHA